MVRTTVVRHRRVTLALIFLTSAATAACGGDGDGDKTADAGSASEEAAPGQVVTIKDFTFAPARIELTKGTTVEWRNEDAFLHTVTSGETSGPENVPDDRFDEDLADKGSTATVTFDEPGTFTYYCRQHNAMDGTIVVT